MEKCHSFHERDAWCQGKIISNRKRDDVQIVGKNKIFHLQANGTNLFDELSIYDNGISLTLFMLYILIYLIYIVAYIGNEYLSGQFWKIICVTLLEVSKNWVIWTSQPQMRWNHFQHNLLLQSLNQWNLHHVIFHNLLF